MSTEEKAVAILQLISEYANTVCIYEDIKEDIIQDCMLDSIKIINKDKLDRKTPNYIFNKWIKKRFDEIYLDYINRFDNTVQLSNCDECLIGYCNTDRIIDELEVHSDILKVLRNNIRITDRDRYILKNFFGIECERKSANKIAKDIGISQQRVLQLKNNAVKKIRNTSDYVLLRVYVE